MKRPQPLILFTALLTFAVVTLGAFVRLSDAGLGCPDWPGCYGQLAVPSHLAQTDAVAHTRAWLEMIHRYAAGTLALMILLLVWQHRHDREARPLAAGLVALLVFQALLGMWTVTLMLMPVVVMGHLLGGLALLGLLWVWHQRVPQRSSTAAAPQLRGIAIAALLALLVQIALGGWTSANYAAVACPDLPLCQGRWWPEADFAGGFSLPEPVNASYEGGGHNGEARTAIHLSHRIGSLLVLALTGLVAISLVLRRGPLMRSGLLLGGALLLQFFLGLANVLFHFPLGVAVAHTAGAGILLLALLHVVRLTSPRPA